MIYSEKDIIKKLGLKKEAIKFYVKMGVITQNSDGSYEIDERTIKETLFDRDSVFRFYIQDNFMEDIHNYANAVNNTGKVKHYSKKEIEEYIKNKKSEVK